MPHDRRPPPAPLTNDELKSLAETARIAAEWGRPAHPLVVADLADELSATRAALEEARGLLGEAVPVIKADLSTATDEYRRALPENMRTGLANAIRADIDLLKDLLKRIGAALNVTAATPEVDRSTGAAPVDGFRPVGDAEPVSTTPTEPAERSASSELEHLRARLTTLRAGCLANFGGGHSGTHRDAFCHGMETVCNVVDAYLADVTADPNMTHSVGTAALAAESKEQGDGR